MESRTDMYQYQISTGRRGGGKGALALRGVLCVGFDVWFMMNDG